MGLVPGKQFTGIEIAFLVFVAVIAVIVLGYALRRLLTRAQPGQCNANVPLVADILPAA